MTLYEQIEDSYDKSYEYIGEEPEFDSGWRAAISYVLHTIISQHRCIPERDALAFALRTMPVPATYEEWLAAVDRSYEADADAIIATLEKQND